MLLDSVDAHTEPTTTQSRLFFHLQQNKTGWHHRLWKIWLINIWIMKTSECQTFSSATKQDWLTPQIMNSLNGNLWHLYYSSVTCKVTLLNLFNSTLRANSHCYSSMEYWRNWRHINTILLIDYLNTRPSGSLAFRWRPKIISRIQMVVQKFVAITYPRKTDFFRCVRLQQFLGNQGVSVDLPFQVLNKRK